jgi:hypothetical protein
VRILLLPPVRTIAEDAVCLVCGEKAFGYNIKGYFCHTHKDILVRDWSQETRSLLEVCQSSNGPVSKTAAIRKGAEVRYL